ncbi:MAG: RagB/SusD family nutrient uptake outer membrane protein [Bacteroidaceae bacterium]|nr:RagB/SusD family nutrient uptake outer membrane protein [Bacteroidaceae bacterium]
MKRTSIISLLIACFAFGSLTTSCDDMLSPDSERHSYSVAQDTLYSYWGILKSWQNIAERTMILGECRGELVSGTGFVSDSISAILNFEMDKATDGSCRFLRASDYYHVINSCNAYLAQCDRQRVTGTLKPYMLPEAAQVEAIRAWTYLQLVQVYGEVPFYTEPLLTTDDISAFMKNHPTATADNLVDLLADDLKKAQAIEMQYGLPQYDNYELTCHSSKAMIPLNLILADLYLTKGDKQSCETAAQYYYDYLSNNQGRGNMVAGGTMPASNYCFGYQGDGMDRPTYSYIGTAPWSETEAVSSTSESITAIPSATNKLWGTVLRGVNELYGYTSEIAVLTGEVDDTTSVTVAAVLLTDKYDAKQLAASETYFNLCKEQTYEVLTGPAGAGIDQLTVTADTIVGDTRQYWVQDKRQTYPNGLTNTEKFVTKQNPYDEFSTVAHMIYRKSMVWLRFAEALNGAGYPSYAFAILKNGLCNNDEWFPKPSGEHGNIYDYAVKDSAWVFKLADGTPVEKDADEPFATEAEMRAHLSQLIADGELTEEDSLNGTASWSALSFENYPADNCQAILYYIDRREALRNPSFLNFDFESLNGNIAAESYVSRTSLLERGFSLRTASISSEDRATRGVHSKGCGYIPLDKNRESEYDYVKMLIKKAKENYGVTLTKESIYDGTQDDVVQKCVEDLIVDEEALELAFEGTRFFDLMRVAHRRNDPNYLASRVSRRNSSLKGKLQNPKNWYFPLPSK